MPNYIYNPDSGELYHYGVKGMKWGVRRAVRGHGGPGIYVGNKRKIEGYKKDLKVLDEGGHLSVGIGKKRQAMYDRRDRRNLENRLAKAEAKERDKAEMKAYKKERQALRDEYGRLEDQYTYGKNANAAKNAKIDKRMAEIDDRMSKMESTRIGKKVESGERATERLKQGIGHKTVGSVMTLAVPGAQIAGFTMNVIGDAYLIGAGLEAYRYSKM